MGNPRVFFQGFKGLKYQMYQPKRQNDGVNHDGKKCVRQEI